MFVMLIFVGSGLLIAGLGVPLWKRKVPPNALYGLRIPATLKDEEIWYEANALSGRDSIVAGSIIVAVALLQFAAGVPLIVATWVNFGVTTVVTLAMCIKAWAMANALSRAKQKDKGSSRERS